MKTLILLNSVALLIACGDPKPIYPSVDLNSGDPPAKVLQQAEYYYAMVKQNSPDDYMERCVKASSAMAAASLANDDQAFLKWKAIGDEDCHKANK